MPETWLGYLVAAMALLLAWRTYVRARVAEADVERYRRRHRLVSRAALELQQLRGPDDVFQELPELLVQAFGCRSAFVLTDDEGVLRPVAQAGGGVAPPAAGPDAVGEVGLRAVRERRLVYLDSVAGEPAGTSADPDGQRRASLLARPLFAGDDLAAVLVARCDGADAFDRLDRDAIEAVGRLAEEALLRLGATAALRRRQRESEALARATESLLLAQDQATAAEAALRTVLELLDVRSAAVLRIAGDRLVPVARVGDEAPEARAALDRGLPFTDGRLREAWRDRRTRLVAAADGPDPTGEVEATVAGGAVVPVTNGRGTTRALLVAAAAPGSALTTLAHESLLNTVATSLGATLQRIELEHQLHDLLDVVRGLAQSDDPEELYALAVAAAVRLIPGAEAASILVHRGDGFHFAGAANYDLDSLASLGAFGYEEQMRWYGLGRAAFLRGVPRILRGAEIARRSASATRHADQVEILRTPGRVSDLKASLCVPIASGTDILGILNVDNLSLEEAFGDAELELAEAFGQQIGVIIRQTQTREALARAAVTDPVTGLGNREGFNRRLAVELARARRRDERVHLVMMDLDGFKRVNDELGHAAGDGALQRVARALEANLRAEDGLFRWGGDEFVLLIGGVDEADARKAAERHAAAVADVDVAGRGLAVSIGIASFPEDGSDAEALLRRADDLMYQRKGAGDGAPDPAD